MFAPQRTRAPSPRAAPRPARSMLPAAMKGLGLALLAVLLCSAPEPTPPPGPQRPQPGPRPLCPGTGLSPALFLQGLELVGGWPRTEAPGHPSPLRASRTSHIQFGPSQLGAHRTPGGYVKQAHGLWCQDCTLTTNSSHCTPKQCQPSDTVCASVRITDPSSSRKDHSVNKMCASSCDFVKRHFFSDYLMGFINSGILKVDVDCCEKDLCNGVAGAGHSPWALAGGLLLSLGPALLWAGP
ncbi:lymphocyte antigen 6H isoform X2 [Papio anubis]|uniref:lymphocyte antigen 6H isoform X2 n=1 Tax=Papio anubis TaxID=9555 RepID=UPI0012AE2BC2|nr:lymphocyte antigen 6H isoform X2 [Papio anubis]XP_017817891.2 lymphocyte antigen 6H isoform X2 [Papio anubis]